MTSSKQAFPSQGGVITPVFEALPPLRRDRSTDYNLASVLPTLKKKPDTWARVAELDDKKLASRIAHAVNKGRNRHFGVDFAACVRMVNGKFALYMRYVGEEETSE